MFVGTNCIENTPQDFPVKPHRARGMHRVLPGKTTEQCLDRHYRDGGRDSNSGSAGRETKCVNSCGIMKQPARITELDVRVANLGIGSRKPFDENVEGRVPIERRGGGRQLNFLSLVSWAQTLNYGAYSTRRRMGNDRSNDHVHLPELPMLVTGLPSISVFRRALSNS
jgi:hypothetical protein